MQSEHTWDKVRHLAAWTINPHTKKTIKPKQLMKLSIDYGTSLALDQPDVNDRLFKLIEYCKRKGKTSHIPQQWLTK